MKDDSLALVIPAYNRLESLARLLSSVGNLRPADFEVTLIITLEGDTTSEVINVAESFEWHLGEKRVVRQKKQLGLREHILFCGDQTEEFDHVIVVEDDLYLSPHALEFTRAATDFYSTEDRVAGISLYSPAFSEISFRPFVPHHDEYDGYFMQQASSWGQIWSRDQWNNFRSWYAQNLKFDFEKSNMPWNIKIWPKTSWKRYFMAFICETDRHFYYPRVSLSTNFSDSGTHQRSNTRYQVQLQNRAIEYRFPKFGASESIYDVYYERLPGSFRDIAREYPEKELIVDLYGNRAISRKDHGRLILTSKTLESEPIRSYGLKLKPHEDNVIRNIPGDEIFLYLLDSEVFDEPSGMRAVSEPELTYWAGLKPNLLAKYSDIHLRQELEKHLDDLGFLKHLRTKMWMRAVRRWFIRVQKRLGIIQK